MRIPLDRQSEIPLYNQIKDYLSQGILSGSFAPETRLPASRKLANDLGVNRITVETAYSELEADGLIYSKVGSGTYVLPAQTIPLSSQDDLHRGWPFWQKNIQVDLPQPNHLDFVRDDYDENFISFASGTSAPLLFPADDFRKSLQTVMRRDGIESFKYGDKRGYAPLRRTITHVLASQGLQSNPENILITAGSQQALSLVSQLLLKAGDTILVESPTYGGALELFQALNYCVIGIPMDNQGMQVEKLEKVLQQHHPKLIYTIPNFHNPTGSCLSGSRRRKLLVLADRYNIPILEDDFVGDLRYDGRTQPSLKALDPGGRVIYASTFSKMIMPGLRVGFLLIEGPIYQHLVNFKRVNDLATSSLIQRALESYVTVGRYQAHLRRSCQIFRKRRDAMIAAIQRYLPTDITYETPQGGLFLWVCLPDRLSADNLLILARQENVNFVPGTVFFQNKVEGKKWMRLNFVTHPTDKIEEGIRRLSRVLGNNM